MWTIHCSHLDALDGGVDGEDLELLDDDGRDADGAVRGLRVYRLYHPPVGRACKQINCDYQLIKSLLTKFYSIDTVRPAPVCARFRFVFIE